MKFLRNLTKQSVLFFYNIIKFLFLRNPEKSLQYKDFYNKTHSSEMVQEFNFWHKIFVPFFKKTKIVSPDITQIKQTNKKGPIVFILKNKGKLEYRFFNQLFLKEKIVLCTYSNATNTVLWRPFKQVYQYFLGWVIALKENNIKGNEVLAENLKAKKNVFLNLRISRDYLFGLIQSNPLEPLTPLLELQKEMNHSIQIVPVQFLYDKQPEKTEKSFFDFLFGEKSCPGAIRKFLLFFVNYRKKPQAKFSEAIDLKTFVEKHQHQNNKEQSKELFHVIEHSLRIERARITGPLLNPKFKMIHDILESTDFRNILQNQANETGKSFESLLEKAEKDLNDIAADVNYSYVHFSYLLLNYVWHNIYDGLVVKHDQLNKIRQVAGKHPVVLVPMHRSHIDYLLISHIFYSNNITFPHICAGDNMNFWPVGRLVRKCGGFFIKRKFDKNTTYKESLFHYIKKLVQDGFCLEFFIEGTRSRTGKLLKPKMGILSMILRSFAEGASKDIYFVPIAINYDQIIEQKAYQSEQKGKEKKKENAMELVKVKNVLNKKYGKVYIEFADPISLKDFFKDKDIHGKSIKDLRQEVSDFAYHITYNMNKVAIITPISIVSTAILSLRKGSFSFDELMERIQVLKDYLDYKNVNYSDLIHYSERWAYNEAIQKLVSRHLISEVETYEEVFYKIEDSKRHDLDYYKNNILHFFVSLACFTKIVFSISKEKIHIDEIVKEFEVIKSLFDEDFIFSQREPLKNHIKRVIQFCHAKEFLQFSATDQTITLNTSNKTQNELSIYSSLFDNFLESHLLTLKYLKFNRFEGIDQKTLIRDILEKSKSLYIKEDLFHSEALNRFNIENSLKTFSNIGIVKITKDNKGKSLLSSINDNDMIEKWISHIKELLNPVGNEGLVPPKSTPSKSQEDSHIH